MGSFERGMIRRRRDAHFHAELSLCRGCSEASAAAGRWGEVKGSNRIGWNINTYCGAMRARPNGRSMSCVAQGSPAFFDFHVDARGDMRAAAWGPLQCRCRCGCGCGCGCQGAGAG